MEKIIFTRDYTNHSDYLSKANAIFKLARLPDYSVYLGVSVNNQTQNKMIITISPNGIASTNPSIIDSFRNEIDQLFS